MTIHANAHREGNARMNRAMSPTTTAYVRVAGHAGVWEVDGPALVLTDDDQFEHPSLVVVHQVVDPGRFAVVEAADVTPFAPADVSVPPIAV